MDQSDDQWLQDPAFKRSGEARPGESASALIKRYRAGMIRRTGSRPRPAGKKTWVEASAAYALILDKLWARHRQATKKSPPPSSHCVIFSGSFPVRGSVQRVPQAPGRSLRGSFSSR